jgi:Protein of unknown function (DUF1203)
MSVHPIDPARLDDVRRRGEDVSGNPFTVFEATGDGEPLRCCLRFARAGERIALISYSPFEQRSVWREVGPVYVHADHCEGYAEGRLPDELRHGPRVLRTYRADGSMDYEHNTLVGDEDIEPVLDRLLGEPEVATVHVRAVLPQCFLYAVTR